MNKVRNSKVDSMSLPWVFGIMYNPELFGMIKIVAMAVMEVSKISVADSIANDDAYECSDQDIN